MRLIPALARIAAAAALTLQAATPLARDLTQPQDLLQVYLSALQSNPAYQSSLADFRATAEQEPQAVARLLPQLQVQGEYGVVRQGVEGDFFGIDNLEFSDTFDRFAISVGFSQPVFRRDALLNLDRAELEVGRAQLRLTDARHDLMIRAADAYFAVLSAEDNLRLVRAEKSAISSQFDQARGRFDSGFLAEADLLAVQAQLDSVLASEIEAENAIEIARTRLEFVSGDLLQRLRGLPVDAPLPPLQPEAVDDWLARAEAHNIGLLAQTVGLRVAEVDERIAAAGHLPALDLVGSHIFFDANGGVSGARKDEDSRIQIVLSVPIFEGGLVRSQVREARARSESAHFSAEQARAQARLETRSAFLNARAARSRADALVRALESAKAAEEAARVSFDVGSRTAAEYLGAVRERYRAERDLSQARYGYVLSLLRLRRAAGVMTVADLDDLNNRLR